METDLVNGKRYQQLMAESINTSAFLTPATTIQVLRGEKALPADPEHTVLDSKQSYDDSGQELKNAVSRIEEFISRHSRQLEFSVDDDAGRLVVTVREKHTGEIIRQIPPEEVLSVAANIADRLVQDGSGLLLRART